MKHSNRGLKLSDENHSRSKSQMSLKKIIEVITLGRSFESSSSSTMNRKLESGMKDCRQRGIGIDLNLRLGPNMEPEIQNTGFSACSGVGEGGDGRDCGGILNRSSTVVGGGGRELDKSSEGECDPKQVANSSDQKRGGEKEGGDEDVRELSEITNLPSSEIGKKSIGISSDKEGNEINGEKKEGESIEENQEKEVEQGPKKMKNDRNYLSLLVEAARLVSGGFEDEDEDEDEEEKSKGKRVRISDDEDEEAKEKKSKKSKGKKENEKEDSELEMNYEDIEDISPVVRSKRGRNQVLPHRYRDSVLEPWKRLTQRSARVSGKARNK